MIIKLEYMIMDPGVGRQEKLEEPGLHVMIESFQTLVKNKYQKPSVLNLN